MRPWVNRVEFVPRTKSSAATTELPLRKLVDAIVANNRALFSEMIRDFPELATATFLDGAARQRVDLRSTFIPQIGHYINSGDTALHFAAASYRAEMASMLIKSGAAVRSRNRRGTEPLHLAAVGGPNSPRWDPAAQAATIVWLIEAGADPNAKNMDGTTPLHRAVRTRCAGAVRALLENGADPTIRTKNGSTAGMLALFTTGRGGTGSPEAKAQQREILSLLGG